MKRSVSAPLTALIACLLATSPSLAAAQGIIAGIVRDTAARPVAGADVVVKPGEHRTRTDSAGRFIVTGLGADRYQVRARKLGFGPTTYDVDLSSAGRVDIAMVFDQPMPMLDTIKVVAGRSCSEWSLDGFVCRRKGGGGVFLDYTEIDDKDAYYTADLFRDMKGFRTDIRSTRFGPVRYVRANPMWGCITQLVDGRPASLARPVPDLPTDLIAIEVYARPDSVPHEYQKYTWPAGDITRSGRCSVIAYWTTRARSEPR